MTLVMWTTAENIRDQNLFAEKVARLSQHFLKSSFGCIIYMKINHYSSFYSHLKILTWCVSSSASKRAIEVKCVCFNAWVLVALWQCPQKPKLTLLMVAEKVLRLSYHYKTLGVANETFTLSNGKYYHKITTLRNVPTESRATSFLFFSKKKLQEEDHGLMIPV